MLRPNIRANDARANHCSVKNESGRVAPLPVVSLLAGTYSTCSLDFEHLN